MKVLVISDSFKGTLSSMEVGQIATEVFTKKGYDCNYVTISDGGEGFVEAVAGATKLPYVTISARNPYGKESSEARYVFDNKTKTAYIELAEASGIIKMKRLNPFEANTFGTGEVIKHAILQSKAQNIVVGLGGSASIDLGTGMLEALGALFYDEEGNIITDLCNDKLKKIKRIDDTKLQELIKNVSFTTLTDVEITILGPAGTIEMYAPQKGATKEDLITIISNSTSYLESVKEKYLDAYDFLGSGAAGGVSYALKYFCNSATKSGIDTVLEMINFNQIKNDYDVIITGEGKYDNQTTQGKVIAGIKKYQPKRIVILTGVCDVEDYNEVYAIVPKIASFEESMANPRKYFAKLCSSLDLEKENIGKTLIALSGHTAAGKTSIGKYLEHHVNLLFISEGEIKRSFITNYNANDSLNEELRNKGYSCSIDLARKKINESAILIDASFHKKERRKMLNDAFSDIDECLKVWIYCFCSDEKLVEERISKRKTQVKTANNQADSMSVYYHIMQTFDFIDIKEMIEKSIVISIDTAINKITGINSNFDYQKDNNVLKLLSIINKYLEGRILYG